MKRMRKIIMIISICVLAFSMVGCGKEEKGNSDTVIIRVLENDTAKSEGYLDELINAFNEAYKDKWTVAVGLMNLDETQFVRFAAGAIFIAVPIVALYFVLSKYLVTGVTAGAVKQ